MNMCIFGAVALGPFIGGVQAESARVAAALLDRGRRRRAGVRPVVLTFEDAPPANPDSPRALPAVALAAAGSFAAFIGASELTSHNFLDPRCIAPLPAACGDR